MNRDSTLVVDVTVDKSMAVAAAIAALIVIAALRVARRAR